MKKIFQREGYIFMPVQPADWLKRSKTVKDQLEKGRTFVVELNNSYLTTRFLNDHESFNIENKKAKHQVSISAAEALKTYRTEKDKEKTFSFTVLAYDNVALKKSLLPKSFNPCANTQKLKDGENNIVIDELNNTAHYMTFEEFIDKIVQFLITYNKADLIIKYNKWHQMVLWDNSKTSRFDLKENISVIINNMKERYT